jgi:hypothetical protein
MARRRNSPQEVVLSPHAMAGASGWALATVSHRSARFQLAMGS